MGKYTQEDFERIQSLPQSPVVTADLSGKTVIVIGANTGLGFETTKHLANMNPHKLILGCRSKERGEEALKRLTEETCFKKAELWLIDLSDFASVRAFADRAQKELERIDILIENAAKATHEYSTAADGWESTLQTNNLGPELLAFLLLPKMIDTAGRFSVLPRLVVVASSTHNRVSLDDQLAQAANIHEKLSDKEYCSPEVMAQRYPLSKLLNVFFVRSLSSRLPSTAGDASILVNAICPGFCVSDLRREFTGDLQARFDKMERELGFTTEEGSRHIIYGAVKGLGDAQEENKLRGQYLSSSTISEVSDFVLSDAGAQVGERLWHEAVGILSKVDERVGSIVNEYLAHERA